MAKNNSPKIQLDPTKLLGFGTVSRSAAGKSAKVGNKIGAKVGAKVGGKGGSAPV